MSVAASDAYNPAQAVVVKGVEAPCEGGSGHPALTAKQQDRAHTSGVNNRL